MMALAFTSHWQLQAGNSSHRTPGTCTSGFTCLAPSSDYGAAGEYSMMYVHMYLSLCFIHLAAGALCGVDADGSGYF